MEWAWIYLTLSGLNDMLVQIPSEIADALFEGRDIPNSFKARHFTTVKVRKEAASEMQARAQANKIEMPIQETIIETFPWIVEQEKAVNDGVIFSHAIAWARRPCKELVVAAEALWSEKKIIEVRSPLHL